MRISVAASSRLPSCHYCRRRAQHQALRQALLLLHHRPARLLIRVMDVLYRKHSDGTFAFDVGHSLLQSGEEQGIEHSPAPLTGGQAPSPILSEPRCTSSPADDSFEAALESTLSSLVIIPPELQTQARTSPRMVRNKEQRCTELRDALTRRQWWQVGYVAEQLKAHAARLRELDAALQCSSAQLAATSGAVAELAAYLSRVRFGVARRLAQKAQE